MKGVGRKALSGISWTLFGAVLSNVLRIAVVAALGRLLTAADFGIVAAAMTVVLLAGRFREIGIGLALVQRKTIERAHVETTLAIQLLLGVGSGLVVFVGAGPLAAFYRLPSAAPLQALSLLFVMRGLSSTSQFLCQREMKFRAIALIDVIAYTVGSVVAIALAWRGHGPWALVIGYLVETATDATLTVLVQPPKVMPRLHRAALRDLMGFGFGQTAAGIANYFATQGDYIVVGRMLSEVLLGVYTRAYELMRFPSVIFNNIAGGVLFSSFAKLQDDPERLGLALRRVLFANAVLLLPASAGLIILAPEAIAILLGPGWGQAVLPFQIMAVSMLWRTGHKATALVARSAGDVWSLAIQQALYAVAVIGGALISVRWGIVGVAVTTTIAVFFQFTNLARLALRRVSMSWGEVIAAHVEGCWLAVLAAAGALPVAWLLRQLDAAAAVIAVAASLAGVVLPAGYAWLRIRAGAADWVWLMDRIGGVLGKKKRKGKGRPALDPAEPDPAEP